MDFPDLTGMTLSEVEEIQAALGKKTALMIEETNSDMKRGRSIINARVIRQHETERILKITVSYF